MIYRELVSVGINNFYSFFMQKFQKLKTMKGQPFSIVSVLIENYYKFDGQNKPDCLQWIDKCIKFKDCTYNIHKREISSD